MAKNIVLVFLASFISIIMGANLLTHAKKMTQPVSSEHYYSIWAAKAAMVNLLTDHADTVIFGDSIAYGGINPKALNPHVYNFAIDGNSPLESYFFLKYMIKQGKHPKNVVLSYNSYFYLGSNFWDQILGFDSVFISRNEAKEILIHDQATDKVIFPYSMGYQQSKPGSTVRIPYYYDIAAGAFQHIKPDFNIYVSKLMAYYDSLKENYHSHGWGLSNAPKNVADNTENWCTKDHPPPTYSDLVIPYYLKKLVDLANENNINVYLLGGPMPESCIALGYPLNPALSVDTDKLKLAGIQNRIPVADKLMLNAHHLNLNGANYYTEKIKPFFDAMR